MGLTAQTKKPRIEFSQAWKVIQLHRKKNAPSTNQAVTPDADRGDPSLPTPVDFADNKNVTAGNGTGAAFGGEGNDTGAYNS